MEQKEVKVKKGTWGGHDINVTVEESGVSIEFGCADARIDRVLTVDRHKRFSVDGTYTAQGPGPIRVDRPPVSQKARFEGKVTGKQMTIKVTLTDSKTDIGTFNVEHGKMGRVFRCY